MTKKSDVKLLVIEDSQTEIEKLKYFLETEEFQVEWVKNADEAFAYLKKETPTLILSDIIMPGISGFDLTGKLKRDKRYRHIPIVLITSLSEPQDVIRGLECGANNFITKPYTRDYLISRIKYLLTNYVLHFPEPENGSNRAIKIYYEGKRYMIATERRQIIDLLLSVYEAVNQKNKELERINTDLLKAGQELFRSEEKLKELNKELERAALTDSLTQLSNRRDMLDRIGQESNRFQRNQHPFSLIMCDLDDFKSINDNYGHEFGDHVLMKIGDLLKSSLRKPDSVARWGGEEFLMLLPETNLAGAKIIASRICRQIRKCDFTCKGNKVRVTATLGVAIYKKEMDINECISLADRAMYLGKEKGKNRLVLENEVSE